MKRFSGPAFYAWTIEVRVPNTLVARGGVVDREVLQDMLAEKLDAHDDENVRVMVLKAPDEKAILREQR